MALLILIFSHHHRHHHRHHYLFITLVVANFDDATAAAFANLASSATIATIRKC